MGRADRVVAFIENLTITAGTHAGQPFRLRDWQKEIIHGIYEPELDGRRLVRTALLTLPRKNGKTQLAAGLALAHLFGPESEERGQVYSAAADRNQAALIFNEAAAMVRADPELDGICNVIESQKRIVHYRSGSFYAAVSSDSRTAHGFSASAIIYDELAQAPNRKLFDVLTTSTGARAQPLTVVISTQSSDSNHIMSELVAYGRQVLDGVVDDPTFFAAIYAAALDADPWSEATWRACNPALGDFRSLEELRQYAEQAKRIPAREAAFRALYLNQPVDAEARFIGSADWRACGGAVDAESLRGRPCWGGLDLSSTTDLTALVLYFPEDAGAVLAWFWLPAAGLEERENRDRVPYRVWSDQDHIELTPGRAIDKRSVAGRLAEVAAEFDIQGLAFDRWRIKDLQNILDGEGIELPLVDFGQGFISMGPAVDALETAILDLRIRHGGHPVLTWNTANAVVEMDPAGNRKLSKARSIARIDGLVALTMAVGLHARQPVDAPQDWSLDFVVAV